jgi:BMFP domain-containing protein YqiC
MISELERLEKKTGRLHTVYDHRRVAEKMAAAPGDLKDEEIAILQFFGGDREATRARAAREQALHPSVAAPAPVAAARGVEFPDQLWDTDAPDQVREMDKWSAAHAMKVLPLRIWWAFTKATREKREALEKKVAQLEARINEVAMRTTLEITSYAGEWKSGVHYLPGSACKRDGWSFVARHPHISTSSWSDHEQDFQRKSLVPVVEVSNLETRVKELEARSVVQDKGVWAHGKEYAAGDIVSHAGSGWICKAAHFSVGSEPSHDAFRMFVKSGRDSRSPR